MSDSEHPIDWRKTRFEGSRREQLRRAQAMSVRERLEALDQLTQLSERMQAMPRQSGATPADHSHLRVQESPADYRVTDTVHEIVLDGCTPTPLAHYLKALGVLRLLSAKYPGTRGFWCGDKFVLRTALSRSDLEQFFLMDYQPSALVTPWNGRGGFLEGDDEGVSSGSESNRAGAQMVRTFSKPSIAKRFRPLATVLNSISNVAAIGRLNAARAELKRLKVIEKTKGKKNLSDEEKETISRQDSYVKNTKGQLLQELRNNLADDVLSWFDACMALVNDSNIKGGDVKKSAPSPLLGAGGLDGSMDFGVNYLKRLNDVFDPITGLPRDKAKEWLDAALFGDLISSLFSESPQDRKKVSVGQFSPAQAGGYNADNGFTGEALLNPWNTILQLEGAVLFAASAVRRLEGNGDIHASLPFTVAPMAFGQGITLSDEAPKGAKRRTAETWLPLWDQPATCHELEAVLREGRIVSHGRSVTNGFDCIRALASLGTSLGIGQFQRFAFLKRSGDAFFALDCGRFRVRVSAYNSLIDELDNRYLFLTKLHAFVRTKTRSGEWKASAKLRVLAYRLDNQIVRILRTDDPTRLQKILGLLGEIQGAIARSSDAKKEVPPVPRLCEQWVIAADDGTPAFRIAKALAGLRGVGKERPLPLRSQLFPVHPRFNEWMTSKSISRHAAGDPACRFQIYTSHKSDLVRTLYALLARRLWLAQRMEMDDKPLRSYAGVPLDDIVAFLLDDRMDARIAALLPGLCLCTIPKDTDRTAGEGVLPAAFGLMKLALTPDCTLRSLGYLGEANRVPVPVGMMSKLVAGNHNNGAVMAAWRRLHASGLTPFFTVSIPTLAGVEPMRAAAALLIPLHYGAAGVLARTLLEEPEIQADTVATV